MKTAENRTRACAYISCFLVSTTTPWCITVRSAPELRLGILQCAPRRGPRRWFSAPRASGASRSRRAPAGSELRLHGSLKLQGAWCCDERCSLDPSHQNSYPMRMRKHTYASHAQAHIRRHACISIGHTHVSVYDTGHTEGRLGSLESRDLRTGSRPVTVASRGLARPGGLRVSGWSMNMIDAAAHWH